MSKGEMNLNSKSQAFRDEIRGSVKGGKGFYVILEMAKKVKLKNAGLQRVDKPAYTIYINVVESNLPMPASMYNPVFKFKRGSPYVETEFGTGIVDKGDKFVGCPLPAEYFVLPDYENKINSDAVVSVPPEKEGDPVRWRIGDEYLTSAFLQIFDSASEADAFIDEVKRELQQFLNDLDSFVKTRPEMVEWGGYEHHAVTKTDIKHARFVRGDGTVASFTEGNIKAH